MHLFTNYEDLIGRLLGIAEKSGAAIEQAGTIIRHWDYCDHRFHDPLQGRRERLRKRFAALGEIIHEFLAAVESDEQIHASAVEWVEQDYWHTGTPAGWS